MATTYTLIASSTPSTGTTSVIFSSIPQTYTDLELRFSARRQNGANIGSGYSIYFNNNTSGYSSTYIDVTNNIVTSSRLSNRSQIDGSYVNDNASTANTFSNSTLYIPNYTASTAKPISLISPTENNGSNAPVQNTASLWNNTAAITSINIDIAFSGYVSGSSFYLYGIKNS